MYEPKVEHYAAMEKMHRNAATFYRLRGNLTQSAAAEKLADECLAQAVALHVASLQPLESDLM